MNFEKNIIKKAFNEVLPTKKYDAVKKTEEEDSKNVVKVELPRLSSESFGHGAVGEVREEVIQVGDRKRNFVIKTFNDENLAMLETSPEYAYKMYTKLKQIKTPHLIPTFRILEKKGKKSEILMTNLNTEEHFAYGGNANLYVEKRKEDLINNVTNWDEIIDETLKTVQYVADNNMSLSGDCWMLLVPSEGDEIKLDLSIADVDVVSVGREKLHVAYDRLALLFVNFLSQLVIKDAEVITPMWQSMISKIHQAAQKNDVEFYGRDEYMASLNSQNLLNFEN